MGKLHRFWFIILGLITVLATTFGFNFLTQAQSRDTAFQAFIENFDSYNSSLWHIADGWANGDPFDCGWEAMSVFINGGIMSLQINNLDCPCSERPYASGEYRSNGFYQYGTYTVRMKAVDHDGVVSSFFIYTDEWDDGNPWDEIDIEIIGKDTYTLQTNYYTNGVGGHESYIDLGFNAAADFHTYSIEWMPDYIKWYVDEELKHTENGSHGALPTTPGRIMMNFWPGTDSVNDWLGDFVYTGPLVAQYDSVSFEPVDWLNKNYLPLVVR